ncbi:hypothetical protein BH23CHL5_BH23CHL5_07290 [soil metagenome]
MDPTQHSDKSMEELLLQDEYSAEELSTVLDKDLDLIRHAAFQGKLRARIVDHDIISIRREDALSWLKTR